MYLSRRFLAVLIFVILMGPASQSETRTSSANDPAQNVPTLRSAPVEVQQAYAHAEPYMDYALPKLRAFVPVLEGLKPSDSQEQLTPIVNHTAQVLAEALPRLRNLLAREEVAQAKIRLPYILPGTSIPATVSQVQVVMHQRLLQSFHWKDFSYLITSHPTAGNEDMLEEYRTDAKDPNLVVSDESPDRPQGIGFGNSWLIFLRENLGQSRFRYLGKQRLDQHQTLVVAFAQNPDRVILPGELLLDGRTYPLFIQGIVWIDETTFQIVRLQTDLLAPLPSIQLQVINTDIRFSEIHIPQLDGSVWLPKEVAILWGMRGIASGELHLYSKYRLFHATSRIVLP